MLKTATSLQRVFLRQAKHQSCLSFAFSQSHYYSTNSGVVDLDVVVDDVNDVDRVLADDNDAFDGDGKRQVTNIQERVAAQKLPRMKKLVRNLLSSSSSSTTPTSSSSSQSSTTAASSLLPPTTASTLNEAILYWMSRPARLLVAREEGSEKVALKRALDIVFWAAECHQLDRVADAPTLSRLLCLYMSFSRGSIMDDQLDCLYQASRLWNAMVERDDVDTHRRRQRRAINHSAENEPYLVHAHTRLWNRRIQFLTKNTHNVHVWSREDRATVALGGKTTAMECLFELHRLANQIMESNCTSTVSNRNSSLSATTAAANSIFLTLLASYAHLGAAKEAHDVLKHLKQQAQQNKAIEFALTNKHYNAVLMAYSKQAANAKTDEERHMCRQQALHLWEKDMCVDDKNQISHQQLDRHDPVTMSILLTLLARDDPQEAQNLLESMPNATTVHYNTVLTAWAKYKHHDSNQHLLASQRSLHVLQHMQSNGVAPDRISYTAVMDALLQSNNVSALDKVDELLEQIQASTQPTSSSTVHHAHVRPDAPMYIVVLRGLLSCHRRHVESQIKEDICMRMERVVEQMHKHLPPVATNVETYKLVLEGWSLSHSPLAASRAMQLLERMEQHNIVPDTVSLELVLKCLSIKPTNPAWAVAQAQAVLDRMTQHGLRKTPELFQQHLRVLARSGYLDEAQELLAQQQRFSKEKGLQPHDESDDEASFFCIVEGYAKLPNGAEKADAVLQQWTREYGVPPSLRMLAVVMTSWAQHDHPRAIQRVEELFEQAKQISNNQLTGFFYGTYMKSLRKRPNAPVLMEQLLTTMQRDYDSGKSLSKPNASNFATVLVAWSESGQEGAAERTEAILDRLESMYPYDVNLKPTLDCYRGVIVAWALSNHPDCGRRAVAILDRLDQQTGLLPNRSCFRYAIKAIGKSHDLDKAAQAFDLLQRMKQSFENGNKRAEPSVAEYATTLRAIGSTKGSVEARAHAYELVQRVLEDWFEMRRTTRRSSTISSDSKESLNIMSSSSLQELEQLYLQYLWAAFKLLHADARRDVLVQREMLNCPLEILVKPQMRTALQKVISRKTYQEMVDRASSRRQLKKLVQYSNLQKKQR